MPNHKDGKLCPNCASNQLSMEELKYSIPYGIPVVYIPTSLEVWTCKDCGFAWTDHLMEERIDKAVEGYLRRVK